MNKEAIDLLIQKTPRLKRARAKLETMQPGAYVIHRAWGFGQIQSYDERENRLIIDFEDGKKGHPMDPAFCVEKLEILKEDDILIRSHAGEKEVEEMVKSRPTDLIADILSRAPNQEATALELETILSRLLGPTKFKKWWTSTKKALVKDPRIAVPAKKTEPFILRDVPVKAEEEILEEFNETKAPKKKIILASKLIDLSVKHQDIEEALPSILKQLTSSLAETKQLTDGERLFGIWVRNDLARFIHEDVESLEPTSAYLIKEANDLCALSEQIPSTHYRRYIDLIERTLPDQWVRITFDLLKNSSGKLTSECINYLIDKDHEKDITTTLERWLVEQNLKAPVLIWMLKNRNSKRYGKMLEPLMTPRLLNAIFYAIDYEALQNTSNKRIPLAEQVSEDHDLIPDLLADAGFETAHDLAQNLMLNQGFEDLSKKSLLARFIKLFPSVQAVVDGESGGLPAESEDDSLIVSKGSFEDRKKEYETLIQVKIPKNKEDIAEARAHGDLRENAEYKMARQEQDILLTRKSELELDINRAQVTDFSDAPKDNVGIGNMVDLEQASTGQVNTYAILGAWDSDPEKNVLSYQTPLAKALIGQKIGASVEIEIDGHRENWTIRGIRRWLDEKK
ncbi:MAG: transcription elongation factor GreA [Opitutales bacterium]|nr:transcription elongation factor GreA [Opitutales bacterium]